MPYRRLPTTDKARLRALEASLEKATDREDKNFALTNPIIEELEIVKKRFNNALVQYELDTKIQSEKNQNYRETMDIARMYVSHFIQVLFLTSERGEINGGLKYYGLQDMKGKVPSLNTEEEILNWGKKLIEGEQTRMQNGGSAIYNPSIALVKIKLEAFKDASIFQNNLRRNTSRSFDKMREIRKTTNEFIAKMWTSIEENLEIEDQKIKRQIAQEYGIVYVFRRNEKKKLSSKELQRDLVFDFG